MNTHVAHGYLTVGVTWSRRRFACRGEGRRGLSLFVQLPSFDIKIAGEHDPTAVHRVSASGRLPPATTASPTKSKDQRVCLTVSRIATVVAVPPHVFQPEVQKSQSRPNNNGNCVQFICCVTPLRVIRSGISGTLSGIRLVRTNHYDAEVKAGREQIYFQTR